LETEWIAKHEVDRDCERSVGEVRSHYFQQGSNFEEEILLRGESVIPAYFISIKLFHIYVIKIVF